MAQHQVTGTVTDETTGSPLSGATVLINGTNQGTTTNAQGSFTVTLPANKTKAELQISLVGYPSTTVTAEVGKPASVRIRSASTALSDVVVVGYATVRRKDLTGSVS